MAATFGKDRPNGRIIAITNAKMNQPEFADPFVHGVEGLEVLIAAIRDG